MGKITRFWSLISLMTDDRVNGRPIEFTIAAWAVLRQGLTVVV